MTAENNGVPEDDDPFAYLYRSDGADGAEGGAAPTQPMPGVPRTSYQQATQVGRVQYGQQQPAYGQQQPAYGQQQGYGQHDAYGQQNTYGQTQQAGYGGVPHQAEPPMGGGRAASRGGSSGGGSSRGVMIGAVAVVAAVAIGIGMALFNGNDKTNNAGGTGSSASAGATATGSSSASASASASPLGVAPVDAATMTLQGTAPVATPAGAKAANGMSVPITNSQQSITWTVDIPTAGSYHVWIRYNNPGANASDLLLINGQKSRTTDFKNYGGKDPSQTWFRTYNQPDLPAGQVKITIQGVDGQPPVNIDQIAITQSDTKPWS